MKYNKLGNTGLLISELCLGTLTFGDHSDFRQLGGLGQHDADGLVKLAVDAGISLIDTANMYSAGLAEEITGNAIRNVGISRDSLIIATKVRSAMVVRAGKVRYIGASNLASWQLMKAVAYSELKGITAFCSIQSYYSLASRDIERGMTSLLVDQKIGLMVWSPLAGGLLTGKYKTDRKEIGGGRRDVANFPLVDMERTFRVLDVLEPMAKRKQESLVQLSIAWLLQQPVVSTVILGARNANQLRDNIGAPAFSFTREELNELNEVSKLPPEYPCWLFEFAHLDRQLS
jgi:aryl-alcohol dehydrogenase-like predicted oxidoreductase